MVNKEKYRITKHAMFYLHLQVLFWFDIFRTFFLLFTVQKDSFVQSLPDSPFTVSLVGAD